MNSAVLVGNICKDIEVRRSTDGLAVVKNTIAVKDMFKKDKTDFINFVVFGKQAENLARFQQKGSKIGIIGRITTGSYENKQGVTVYTTEIAANQVTFLDTKSNDQNESPVNKKAKELEKEADNYFDTQGTSIEVQEEDLPF